ncbi:hypothetical protein H8D91_00570 [archaeon]|nr:hypothetical protein [archaeon]
MKISELFKRLEKEDFYQDFKKENPESFFAAMLCILTKNENEGDKIQIDFFMPDKKQVAISEYPFICMTYPEDKMESMVSLNEQSSFDLTDLWDIVEKAKRKNNIHHDTKKIIGVFKDNKWTLTCLDSMMGMIKINLDAEGEIIKIEKSNLTDFMAVKKTSEL